MTQKERIEQLEREVADLRALVDVLRTVPRPFNPVYPQPVPTTPAPWQYPTYTGTCL